jgi:Zn finger protein HypA/HybF involved in hydrogenase expression
MMDVDFEDMLRDYGKRCSEKSKELSAHEIRYEFVCTDCRLLFDGDGPRTAICPECGEVYGHFFTKLIRGGTFALAYWLKDFPGEIRQHKQA